MTGMLVGNYPSSTSWLEENLKTAIAPWNPNRQQQKTTINFQANCILSLTKLDFGSWQDNWAKILNSYFNNNSWVFPRYFL